MSRRRALQRALVVAWWGSSTLWGLAGCTERAREEVAEAREEAAVGAEALEGEGEPQELFNRVAEKPRPSCSPSAEESDVSYEELAGEEDWENRYSFTLSVEAKEPSGARGGKRCSGVLIGARVVLTAAQCVCQLREGVSGGKACASRARVKHTRHALAQRPEDARVTTEEVVYEGKVVVHPRFKMEEGANAYNGTDLAVILLPEGVGAGRGVDTPVALGRSEARMGESLVLVNHGSEVKCRGLDEERRFKWTRVTRVKESGGDKGFFEQAERRHYRGQSGGPLLRERGRGWELVGISNQAQGSEPTFTSVAAHVGWIREQLSADSKPDTSTPTAP